MCTSCAKQVAYIGLTQWRPYLHIGSNFNLLRAEFQIGFVRCFRRILILISTLSKKKLRQRGKTAISGLDYFLANKRAKKRAWPLSTACANTRTWEQMSWACRRHTQAGLGAHLCSDGQGQPPLHHPLFYLIIIAAERSLPFFPFRSPLFSFSRCISAWVSNFAIIMQPARPMMHLKSGCCGAPRCRQRRK
jgi:hypothetical protein